MHYKKTRGWLVMYAERVCLLPVAAPYSKTPASNKNTLMTK